MLRNKQNRKIARRLDTLRIIAGGAIFGTCVAGIFGFRDSWEGAAIGAGIMAVLIGTRVIRVTG